MICENFEQLQQAVPPGVVKRVRMECVVYYYDPIWQVFWGKCGMEVGHLSFTAGAQITIVPGERILVEGTIQPESEAHLVDPKVTVLEKAVPLEVIPANGRREDVARFDRRLVRIEGLVDRIVTRDSSHIDFGLIADGELITARLPLGVNSTVPQLRGMLVRTKGIYVARSGAEGAPANVELWVQREEDVEIVGSLERDDRFNGPATPIDRLAEVPPGERVRIEGIFAPMENGRVRVRDGAKLVELRTPQTTSALHEGDRVEAIGVPILERGNWVLQQAIYRDARAIVTRFEQIWQLPEPEQRKWRRLRTEIVVYYYDPVWKSFWAGSPDGDDYIGIGEKVLPIQSRQRVLIEGSIANRDGILIEDAKATVLEENVTLHPLDARGQVADTRRWGKHFVMIEGYVDRQSVTDQRHIELDLVVEGRAVVGRLLIAPGEVVPNWEGALLRVNGVYSATTDPTGALPALEIWCPGTRDIEVVGALAHDPRFEAPVTPIEKIEQARSGAVVHVLGAVRAQQPGRSLTIRDETGQLTLHTAQARLMPLGSAVEAVGVPGVDGAGVTLREGIFRASRTALPPPPAGLPRLRLADQLRELLPEEAARGYPVQLSGVVTWTRPAADFFFIRDASGGVCVYRPAGENSFPLVLGTKVDVTGVSASGKYTPVVLASNVATFSTIELPEPRPVTLEQALTGIEEAQWVSMSGYLRGVESEGPWAKLMLTTSAGEFAAMLAPNERWAKTIGAVLRVRGVCSAEANSRRQLTGIRVWVPSSRLVEVEEAAPVDPFAVAERSIASLRQYSSLDVLNRRVRVAGVVVHRAAGRLVHLQDGNESLLVLSREAPPLNPGDRIEAVGFPGRQNNRLVLREAVCRRIGAGEQPAPATLQKMEPFDPDLDGRVVRATGTLLHVSAHERGVELLVQQGRLIFEAGLDTRGQEIPAAWAPHSQVALTGVYELEFDEYHRPHDVRLLLRTPEDVSVVKRAPWWTAQRALLAIGVLATGLVLGLGWVIALRRRVHRQTELIRERIENEKAARLDAALARASKLESLGVLAGGIAHDFNNLLTVVIGNLSLAKMDLHAEAETMQCLNDSERAATRAKDLTQQLLTFAKGGEPIRASTTLPEVVREAAQFALHGAKVRCEFDIPGDLWPADVDRGQVGQVVNNLIINATQAMAAGGLIKITMRNEVVPESRQGLESGRYVKTSFADSGSGISTENLPRIFEPYFTTKTQGSGLGLATVYSIVKKHRGHVEVVSQVGVGTTFHVWLPAAATPPQPASSVSREAPARAGRVLFMDDEPAIRAIGATVLRRRGFDVTAVGDGNDVVQCYEAARAEQRPFDLVVLDLTVPGGMGGAEAMGKLRALDPAVRAIVASGYSSDPVMANYREHGFLGRVPKPYQASDLVSAVDAVLRE